MKQFNLEENLKTINAYAAKHLTKSEIPVKDFYNVYTGEVTCGECRKTVSGLRALLHWHF